MDTREGLHVDFEVNEVHTGKGVGKEAVHLYWQQVAKRPEIVRDRGRSPITLFPDKARETAEDT